MCGRATQIFIQETEFTLQQAVNVNAYFCRNFALFGSFCHIYLMPNFSSLVLGMLSPNLASIFWALHEVFGHFLSDVMTVFADFPKHVKFLDKTRLSGFLEYTPLSQTNRNAINFRFFVELKYNHKKNKQWFWNQY